MTVHRATAGFWQCYDTLPPDVRARADRNFELLKSLPRHPSLHFKPVGKFWSVRVCVGWRALAMTSSDGFDWFWIGSHADYDQLLR